MGSSVEVACSLKSVLPSSLDARLMRGAPRATFCIALQAEALETQRDDRLSQQTRSRNDPFQVGQGKIAGDFCVEVNFNVRLISVIVTMHIYCAMALTIFSTQ